MFFIKSIKNLNAERPPIKPKYIVGIQNKTIVPAVAKTEVLLCELYNLFSCHLEKAKYQLFHTWTTFIRVSANCTQSHRMYYRKWIVFLPRKKQPDHHGRGPPLIGPGPPATALCRLPSLGLDAGSACNAAMCTRGGWYRGSALSRSPPPFVPLQFLVPGKLHVIGRRPVLHGV